MVYSVLLDILIVAILVLSVYMGFRRGFIKTVSAIVAFVVAAALASAFSGPASQWAYNSTVEPAVVKAIQERISDDKSLESQMDEALAVMPDFVVNLLENAGIKNGADVVTKLEGSTDLAHLPQTITRDVVKPVVMPLLKLACTLILFILVYIVASILLKVLNLVAKLPIIRQFNHGLGAFAGVLSGALWVLFVVSLLQVMAAVGACGGIITQEMLQNAHLVNWVAEINPVGHVLQDMMQIVKQ